MCGAFTHNQPLTLGQFGEHHGGGIPRIITCGARLGGDNSDTIRCKQLAERDMNQVIRVDPQDHVHPRWSCQQFNHLGGVTVIDQAGTGLDADCRAAHRAAPGAKM